MSVVHFSGGWERDAALRGFRFIPPGDYEELAYVNPSELDGAKFIGDTEARLLIPLLENSGLLMPRLDERLRSEDLKITHRLLDIIQKWQA
jgi:hypothetical protein